MPTGPTRSPTSSSARRRAARRPSTLPWSRTPGRTPPASGLGEGLAASPLAGQFPGSSRVFFVHDWDSWRASAGRGRVSEALDPITQNEAYYSPFFRAGERVDIGPSSLLITQDDAADGA